MNKAVAPFVCIIQEYSGLSIRDPKRRLDMGASDATLENRDGA